jgi:phosphoglycerate dehydrogenase-like enzyme
MAGIRVAVIDDWQNAARDVADWSKLRDRAEVVFIQRHYSAADEEQAVQDLRDFDIILPTRERSRFSEALIARLPRLKMMSLTGTRAPNVDQEACTRRGIVCTFTSGGHSPAPAAEMSLALLLAAARKIPQGDAAMRAGRFQEGIPPGINLEGRTLGLVGLGRIGAYMARYGQALGMRVLAWSQNLTDEKAKAAGAERVDKERLFADSDAVSVHLVLGPRSRGLIGAADFARMKTGAIFINTSRGPIVDEAAMIAALREGRIFAGLDVYDVEPLPANHPLRTLPNTVLTPHVGFTTVEGLNVFYQHAIDNILAFLDGKLTSPAPPH